MLNKLIPGLIIGGLLGIAIIVQFTTPATIHPFGLLVFFLCLYAVSLGLIYILMTFIQRIYGHLFRSAHRPAASAFKTYQYATVIAVGPVILTALQTVGRLQVIDVIFTATFVLLGCFYISRRQS